MQETDGCTGKKREMHADTPSCMSAKHTHIHTHAYTRTHTRTHTHSHRHTRRAVVHMHGPGPKQTHAKSQTHARTRAHARKHTHTNPPKRWHTPELCAQAVKGGEDTGEWREGREKAGRVTGGRQPSRRTQLRRPGITHTSALRSTRCCVDAGGSQA